MFPWRDPHLSCREGSAEGEGWWGFSVMQLIIILDSTQTSTCSRRRWLNPMFLLLFTTWKLKAHRRTNWRQICKNTEKRRRAGGDEPVLPVTCLNVVFTLKRLRTEDDQSVLISFLLNFDTSVPSSSSSVPSSLCSQMLPPLQLPAFRSRSDSTHLHYRDWSRCAVLWLRVPNHAVTRLRDEPSA